jgi:hypothetical protein
MRRRGHLSAIAVAFRALHAAIAASFLLAIAYVWWCALTGRRGPALRVAVAALVGEGILVTANGGDCPLGFVQDRVGDPVPLFELFLSPRAARKAVPVLGAVAALGVAFLVRGPRLPDAWSPQAPGKLIPGAHRRNASTEPNLS